MSPAIASQTNLQIALGSGSTGVFEAGVPVLDGEAVDNLFVRAQPAGQGGAFTLFADGDWLVGAASFPAASGLEQAAHRLYLDLLRATEGRHLARIWNYVPAINEPGPAGLENYRSFCQGRSLAFEEQLGADFKFLVPAASAVGCKSTDLTIAFAASKTTPRHVENPRQVPAYDYPREYGPRSPSFARATIVPQDDRATVFISGTAAIRGHVTVAPDGVAEQLDCTLENLGEISRACGLGPSLDRDGRSTRHFKVYLRHAADQPLVASMLEKKFFTNTDRISYLQAEICRAPLLVEIEATLFGVAGVR